MEVIDNCFLPRWLLRCMIIFVASWIMNYGQFFIQSCKMIYHAITSIWGGCLLILMKAIIQITWFCCLYCRLWTDFSDCFHCWLWTSKYWIFIEPIWNLCFWVAAQWHKKHWLNFCIVMAQEFSWWNFMKSFLCFSPFICVLHIVRTCSRRYIGWKEESTRDMGKDK